MNLNTSNPISKSIFPANNVVLQDLDQNSGNNEKRVIKFTNLGIETTIGNKFVYVDSESDDEIFEFNENLDVPDKVIETYKSDKGKLFLRVQFRQRSNGIYPNQKVFPSDYLRNKFPYFLIQFYESKITSN